jgi:hypothetical protein
LFSVDWDWPFVASYFGYVPCNCGFTDGTVDCEHKTATQMIGEARQFIQEHDGAIAEDHYELFVIEGR